MLPPVRLAPPEVLVERRASGVVLRSPLAPAAAARCVGDWLDAHARATPERAFLAERAPDGGWRTLSYGAAAVQVRGIASALLARGAGPRRQVVVLSENGVDHGLLALAAMHVGAAVVPVSTAYSLASSDFARLREVRRVLDPAVVFASDPARFRGALAAFDARADTLVASDATAHGASPLSALAATPPSPAIDAANAAVGPDTVAKILFTSGSTGAPKGVVTTQRMMCTNQEAIAAVWPFVTDEPPVVVDWLPWSHTFGGNHNFNLVLRNGGTLYVDGGRPLPGAIETTAQNLALVPPTLYFNVPRGYDLLLPLLETRPALRDAFFSRLRTLFFAAAALPATTRARLVAAAAAAGRSDLFFSSAWGLTETSPLATSVHFATDRPAIIGLPAPGVDIALVARDDRHEIRVRGPNVTPGYWRADGGVDAPDLDAEGFLCTGDAARLADPDHPELGIQFEGRLGENFKLTSGTWVIVGKLRVATLEALPADVREVVVAGRDQAFVGALLFAPPELGEPGRATDRELLRARALEGLRAHNARHGASSERIRRALLVFSPLSLDAGETTDKGYTNQRRVLERRAADVARLFADPADSDVLLP